MLKLLMALAALLGAADPASRYAEGQVWEYRTRSGDEGSLLKIQSVEDHPAFREQGPVYHISVVGVRLGGQTGSVIQHLPVSRATLDASVTRLSDRPIPFPDAAEGISQWREAEGGVFAIPMSQIIDFVEQAVSGAPQSL